MTSALIIGGTGQDGSYLSRLLLEHGYEVCVTSRRAAGENVERLRSLEIADRIDLRTLDITDFDAIARVIVDREPDEIYHLGGQTSVYQSFNDPLEAFESVAGSMSKLLEVCRRKLPGVRLFNPASSEMFGTCDGPVNTETPLRPLSPYGAAKAAAYHTIKAYRASFGLFAVNGILFNHESPLRGEHFVTSKIVRQAVEIMRGERQELVLGNLAGVRDWGWAPDFVEAIWLTLQQSEPRDYVIATGESHSLEEFVEKVFETLGLDWRDHVRQDDALLRPADIYMSQADPTASKSSLGWQATCMFGDLVPRLVKAEWEQCMNSGDR